MSDETILLPCPFCGDEYAQVRYMGGKWHEPSAFDSGYRGECCGCGAITAACDTEAEAIAAWNTRTATTDAEFTRAVHDGNLWRRVKGHIRCRNCGLNIESVIALDGCNEHAIKHCPNCGHKVVG